MGYVLHERLAQARIKLGLTREQLARRAGLYGGQEIVQLIEDRKLLPHIGTVCSLADALNTSTDYLLGRSDYYLSPPLFQSETSKETQ